jgi:hypothetical protein
MEQTIRRDVKVVIQETSSAYQVFSDHDYMNADFADFAAMALGQFKDALRRPDRIWSVYCAPVCSGTVAARLKRTGRPLWRHT